MAVSTITINFQNATLTTTTAQIILINGSFALDSGSALSIAGTIGFGALSINSGEIDFNVESGTPFTAAIVAPVDAPGVPPTIEVTNFAGSVTVTWPTASGLQTQALIPGDPLTLDTFAN